MDLWEFLVEVRAPDRGEGSKPLPPPAFLIGLYQGLPPGSMTEAAANGSPGETGWTVEAHLIASNSDWSQVGAIASGNWKKKAPDFKPVQRPFAEQKKAVEKKTNVSATEVWRALKAKHVISE